MNGESITNAAKPASPGALWTIAEVAAHLHLHPKTIARWVRTRRFPCVRVGSRLRFDPRDVTAWVSARKEGA